MTTVAIRSPRGTRPVTTAELLNQFPRNWTLTKSAMPENWRYFCMGNALVVGLVERIGRTLATWLGDDMAPAQASKQTKIIVST